MTARYLGPLPTHGRFDYLPITRRADHAWPNGARLAVYLGFNLEHFAFGEGMGARIGPGASAPGRAQLLLARVRQPGRRLALPRTVRQPRPAVEHLAQHRALRPLPGTGRGLGRRGGDELIGHGHSNAERQADMAEADEAALLADCRERMRAESGQAPAGWLSPWISESRLTPDLLAEAGYGYTLNWCHDDQPIRMRTRSGRTLWSVPYPQELNDIPMIIARQMDAKDFAAMVIDNADEMLEQGAPPAPGDGRSRCTPTSSASPTGCATCAARSPIWPACATAARYGSPRRARSPAHGATGTG